MNTVTLLFESFSLGSEMMLLLLPFIALLYYEAVLFGLKKLFLVAVGLIFLWAVSSFSLLAVGIIAILSIVNFILLRTYQHYRLILLLGIGFVINLSALILLKYIPTTAHDLNHISHFAGIVGISFYVFHVWSVFMDIHTKKIIIPIELMSFLTYLLYFPKLITGPLVRYNEFEDQLSKSSVREQYIMEGIGLLLIGLVKKAIADYISLYPTTIYANPQGYSGFEHLFAMYGYALYIFLDFSAYTNMARGISRLFGIELPENFNSPYRSTSIEEFWRRWHISLSHWIRDYIYIPLGGSKKGLFRTYINLFTAFLLSGLWHGAGLGYAIWGAIHGIGIVVNKIFAGKMKVPTLLAWFITFHWVTLGWIFFANPIDNALISLTQIGWHFELTKGYSIILNNIIWYCLVPFVFAYSFWDSTIVQWCSNTFAKIPFLLKILLFWAVIWFSLITHQGHVNTFIYQTF